MQTCMDAWVHSTVWSQARQAVYAAPCMCWWGSRPQAGAGNRSQRHHCAGVPRNLHGCCSTVARGRAGVRALRRSTITLFDFFYYGS